MRKVRSDWLSILLMGVLVLIVGVGLCVKFGMDRATAEEVLAKFPDRGVPRMNITLNGVTLDEIKEGSKETKYEGNGLALYEGDAVREFSGVRVKGRGNLTWFQEKKPYQLVFDSKVDLLGSEGTRKWVLLANSLDKSGIRNDAAFAMAGMMNMNYSERGRFVELYFDGEYEGLYYLMKKVEISKGAVDLREGGSLLMELDTLHKDQEDCYFSYLGDCLVVKDSVNAGNDELRLSVERFMKDYNTLEMLAEKGNYTGLSDIVDIDSFAKYFIISEFSMNPDAYSSSLFFNRNGIDGKISVGPIWDFDFAFGNSGWYWRVDDAILSPSERLVREKEAFQLDGLGEDDNISKLFYYLIRIPEFRQIVEKRVDMGLLGRKQEMMDELNSMLDEISLALMADAEKWGNSTVKDDTSFLLNWVSERYDFFEKEYSGRGVTKTD